MGGREASGVPEITRLPDDGAPAGPAASEGASISVSAPGEGPDGAAVQTQIDSTVLSAMAMLDNPFEWFVPGLTVGGPGMLILVVLGAQVMGGFVWLPAVRRTLREERKRRRPLRPAWL